MADEGYMNYAVRVNDDKLKLVVFDGWTNSTGMNALLYKFCGLSQLPRREFMRKLNRVGHAEHISQPDWIRYSLVASKRPSEVDANVRRIH